MKLDISAVVRVTEQCNLDCEYCYMEKKANENLSLETAENIISSFQNYNNNLAHFTWIGGEPLIRDDNFFSSLINYSQKNNPKNLKISHSIQTNGTLLNEKRRKTLEELGFKIGVSYDGVQAIHDRLRRTKGNKGTHSKVSLQLYNPKEKGVITVITRLSLGHEEEIYNDLVTKAKVANLNFYSPTGEGKNQEQLLLPSKEEAKDMMLKFYEIWKNDSRNFQLNPFAEIVRSFYTGKNNLCDYSALSCYRIVGINTRGEVYTCSRSTHIPEAYMGNINTNDLETILVSRPHEEILDRYLKIKKEGCKYFHLCSGGCPVEAMSNKGNIMEKGYYCCESRGALFNKIDEDLKNERIRENFRKRLFN